MKFDMNVDNFSKQVEQLQGRLQQLYEDANVVPSPSPDLLPLALKELGMVSEELLVAVEELYEQTEIVLATREEVEEERQRYQDLFEFAPDAYLETNLYGKILQANRAAVAMLNISQKFLVDKVMMNFIALENRGDFRLELDRPRHKDSIEEREVLIQPRGGEPFEASVRLGTAFDRQGKQVGWRWTIRDISEHKRAERAIEHNGGELSCDRALLVYAKGEIIPLQPRSIWLVSSGLVKLSTICQTGQEVLLGLAGPETIFGSCLTSLQTYQATAMSKDVRLTSISLAEIAASPKLTQTLFPKITERLKQAESLLAIVGHKRVKDRLDNLLMLLKQEFGEPLPTGTRLSIRLTHEDFANACCTTRVTITRLLSKLQQQDKLFFDSKSHIILKNTAF